MLEIRGYISASDFTYENVASFRIKCPGNEAFILNTWSRFLIQPFNVYARLVLHLGSYLAFRHLANHYKWMLNASKETKIQFDSDFANIIDGNIIHSEDYLHQKKNTLKDRNKMLMLEVRLHATDDQNTPASAPPAVDVFMLALSKLLFSCNLACCNECSTYTKDKFHQKAAQNSNDPKTDYIQITVKLTRSYTVS